MLKRILTLSLSVMMLTSLCPTTSVFATDGKPAIIVEDFEDGVVDSSIVKLNNYEFTQNVSNGVLSITNIVNGSCLGFNHAYDAAKEAVYLSYDIQFKTLPTTVTENTAMIVAGAAVDGTMGTMRIKGTTVDGETKLRFTDQSGNALSNTPVEAGKWYKIIFTRNFTVASTGANSNIAIAAVLDEDGNLIGFNRRTGMGGTHTQYSIIRSASSFTDAEILIDNVKFSAYDRTTYGPSVMDYFVATKANGCVNPSAKSMVVSFEEALKTTPTATITSGSNTIVCSVSQLSSATTTMLYKITWNDDLAAGKNYTLSISGSNEAGKLIVGTDVISFTTFDTLAVHLWEKPTIVGDVTTDTENATTDITFKLNDNPEYANTSFEGAVMAVVLRNDHMADFDIIADTFSADTSITKTLGFTVEAGDKLQLIQMDTASGLTPLAWAEYSVE